MPNIFPQPSVALLERGSWGRLVLTGTVGSPAVLVLGDGGGVFSFFFGGALSTALVEATAVELSRGGFVFSFFFGGLSVTSAGGAGVELGFDFALALPVPVARKQTPTAFPST